MAFAPCFAEHLHLGVMFSPKTGWWLANPSEKWWSSSDGMMTFPTEWENKSHVPNHQPDINYNQLLHLGVMFSPICPNMFFFLVQFFPKKIPPRSRSLRQVAPHHPQRQATLRRPWVFSLGDVAPAQLAVLRPWKNSSLLQLVGYPLVMSNSYWKWPFRVDFPIKNGDFP